MIIRERLGTRFRYPGGTNYHDGLTGYGTRCGCEPMYVALDAICDSDFRG
jgi:hypothetical protein